MINTCFWLLIRRNHQQQEQEQLMRPSAKGAIQALSKLSPSRAQHTPAEEVALKLLKRLQALALMYPPPPLC
ncbi:hypothetical protein TYRP_007589 [Tyrophagus putrescentiae]|nr:hypothetical protein TYRP_007589 [Tyrophagus putrescentiae]